MWTAIRTFLGRIKGAFERLVKIIQNGTFSGESYTPRAGSTLFVSLSLRMRLLVISPLREVVTVTGDLVSAGFLSYL